CDQQEPLGQFDACGDTAGHGAEHEAGGDEGDVDDRLVFPTEAVAQLEGDVDTDHGGEGGAVGGQEGQAQGCDDEDHGHGVREADGQDTCGDRAEALGGVGAVGFDVAGIVDQVDGGGREAEDDEGEGDVEKRALVEDGVGTRGQGRGEHEDVLDPLLGAQRLDHAVGEVLRRLSFLAVGDQGRGVWFGAQVVVWAFGVLGGMTATRNGYLVTHAVTLSILWTASAVAAPRIVPASTSVG